MDIHGYIEQMSPYLDAKDWGGLESRYEKVAQSLAGSAQASRISHVNLSVYEEGLCRGLSLALERARGLSAQAVYFEYDLDNDWASNFFICRGYNAKEAGDEDWARKWVGEVEGVALPAFGSLYETGFDATQHSRGTNAYLIARTVAAFGRCAEKFESNGVAICMGFHDQYPIMRVSASAA